jgi:hypothetical protein
MTTDGPLGADLELDHNGTPPDPVPEPPAHRVSDATTEGPGVEATTAGAVQRSSRSATADAAASRRTVQRLRHLAVHAHTDGGAVTVVTRAADDRGDPVVRSHDPLLPLRRLSERARCRRLLGLRAPLVREHLACRLRGLGTRLAGVPCSHLVIHISSACLGRTTLKRADCGSHTEQRAFTGRSRLCPSLAGEGLCRLAPRAPCGAETILPRTSDEVGRVAAPCDTTCGRRWGPSGDECPTRSCVIIKQPARQQVSRQRPVDRQPPFYRG